MDQAARVAALAAAAVLSGCATTEHSGVAGADSTAESSLGLLGPETPAVLMEVAKAPYSLPTQVDCTWLGGEIARLDLILGPDVDQKPPPASRGQAMGRAATDAVAGLVPYRGVVRWISGAGRKEHALAQAALAAAARRGFLKGLALSRACGERAPATPPPGPSPAGGVDEVFATF